MAVGRYRRFIPAGGSSGAVLTKTSGTNYNVEWAAPAGGGLAADYEAAIRSITLNGSAPDPAFVLVNMAVGQSASPITVLDSDAASQFQVYPGSYVEIGNPASPGDLFLVGAGAHDIDVSASDGIQIAGEDGARHFLRMDDTLGAAYLLTMAAAQTDSPFAIKDSDGNVTNQFKADGTLTDEADDSYLKFGTTPELYLYVPGDGGWASIDLQVTDTVSYFQLFMALDQVNKPVEVLDFVGTPKFCVTAAGALGVGNSASGSTPGTCVKKIQVFAADGTTSLGYIAVYDGIA